MCVHVSVCARVCVCVSEHNVPSIHSCPLAKPDGVHQSETPSRTTLLQFLNDNKLISIIQITNYINKQLKQSKWSYSVMN